MVRHRLPYRAAFPSGVSGHERGIIMGEGARGERWQAKCHVFPE